MDHVHVVFPGRAVGRIQLCTFSVEQGFAARSDDHAPGLAGRVAGFPADWSRCGLETLGRRNADRPHSGPVDGFDRLAVRDAFDHRPAATGELSPRDGPPAVSAICPVECRIATGPTDLS